MTACVIVSYETLFSNEIRSTQSESEGSSPLRKHNLEYELQKIHAKLMALYNTVL